MQFIQLANYAVQLIAAISACR